VTTLGTTPASSALVVAIGQIETALPSVSPTGDTPDINTYSTLVAAIQTLLANLNAVVSYEASL
jgi:hypothetical protein